MAGIKEACGVFGIYDLDGGNVVPIHLLWSYILQHRGQESCGLAVSRTDGERGNVQFHKDLGLVSEVLRKIPYGIWKVISESDMYVILRQVQSVAENAQPLVLSYIKGHLHCAQRKPDQYTGTEMGADSERSDFPYNY